MVRKKIFVKQEISHNVLASLSDPEKKEKNIVEDNEIDLFCNSKSRVTKQH